jgi:hypothetical protein
MDETRTRVENIRNANKICVKKLEAKKSPARPKHRWEDDIKMDLKVLEQ